MTGDAAPPFVDSGENFPVRQMRDSVPITDSVPTRLPIAILKADPRNPRKMAPEATAGLAISMETFGALDIVFNQRTGELVSGHQRVRSLREAGASEVVRNGEWGFVTHPQTGERFPVRFVDWDETKQRMGNLVANNPAQQGDFTLDALEQARALQDETNFAELGLAKLTADLEAQLKAERDNEPGCGHCDPDDVPGPPVEPISKRGDLWELGDHRIMCGDSTSAEDVARLMGSERAVMMATDPPYLVDYTADNHPASAERQRTGKDKTANKNWDAYKDPETSVAFFSDFIRVALGNALIDAPAIYQWHASRRQALVEEAWTANGLLLHQQLIWVKSRPILTRSHFMWQHEPCFYGWIEGRPPALRPPVGGECSTVWTIAGEQDGIHPTQKPVEIFQRPITYHTRPGNIIYEPFSGAGSQIIAAERLGRRCFAMELAPEFVDVAVKRWENFTQRVAVRSR